MSRIVVPENGYDQSSSRHIYSTKGQSLCPNARGRDWNSCPMSIDSSDLPRATYRSRDRNIAKVIRRYLKSKEFRNEYGLDMAKVLRQNMAGIQPALYIHLPKPSEKMTHLIVSFLNQCNFLTGLAMRSTKLANNPGSRSRSISQFSVR